MKEVPQILIVEDSPTQAMLLKALLRRHNYGVRVAVNGSEGLAAARKDRPDLILSDVQMPVMDGYEMCEAIKGDDTLREVPVVLLTVLSNVTDVIRALEARADYFLTKPYHEEKLLAKVASILQWHPLQREVDSEGGLELAVGDERRVISASRRQMLNLLLSVYEDAIQKNRDLSDVREELDGHRRHLEELVEARTRELEEKAEQLKRTHAALEQAKDRERREKELRSLATLSSPPQTGVTAKMYGTMTLMEGFPDTFRHLVDGYKALMDLALDQQAFKVKHDISGRLSSMAESLGFYKAGPRDIVDIHTTALKEKARETATAEKKKAYTGEGWIMVLELMGHLVSFYRNRAQGAGISTDPKTITEQPS